MAWTKAYMLGQAGNRRVLDITGWQFGHLTATKLHDQLGSRTGGARWECKCDCGNTGVFRLSHLREGGTTSCGCRRSIERDALRKDREANPRKCATCKQLKPPAGYESHIHVTCKKCRYAKREGERLRRKHNITIDEYHGMLLKQGELCAICQKPLPPERKKRHVDHCHKTGKVRGVLCHACNPCLGMAKDDQFILHAAIKYLQNTSTAYRRAR